MSTEYFDSQEDLDDSFESLMEGEQDKVRTKELIEDKEYEIESLNAQLSEAQIALTNLKEAFEALES